MDQLPSLPSRQIWKQIQSIPEIPILEETRHRLHHKLRDQQVSFQELAPLVEMDAALCLNLQRHAVRINPDCLQQITGAASCISLIGFTEVVRLVKNLPTVNAHSTDPQEQLYRLMIQSAAFAGSLTACWTAHRHNNSQHSARWSGMLASAPIWIWMLREPCARNWLYLMSQGKEASEALNQVFGVNIQDWQRLAMRLSLPPLAMEFWKPDHWPNSHQWRSLRREDPRDQHPKMDRQLVHLCQQPVMCLISANLLAIHSMIQLHGQGTQRWMTLSAHILGKPQSVLAPQHRTLMLSTARQQHSSLASGVFHWLSPYQQPFQISPWLLPKQKSIEAKAPTSRIKTPSSAHISTENRKETEKRIEKKTPDAPSVPVAPAAPAAPVTNETEERPKTDRPESKIEPQLPKKEEPDPPKPALKEVTNRIALHPSSFSDWHALMKNVIDALCDYSGADFAAILVRNPDHTGLRLVHQHGLDKQPLAALNIDTQAGNLFSKLMEKRAAIHITAANRSRMLKGLPEATLQLLPEEFMVMSVDAGGSPIGLLIAGVLGDQNEPDYKIFRTLCHSACLGLKQLRELRKATQQARQA